LAAAVSARRLPLIPPVAGAYGGFLIHAVADWDWELPAITLAALFCGAAVLVAARDESTLRRLPGSMRGSAVAIIVVVAGLAAIGLIGNSALKSSDAARRDRDWSTAASDARRARTWMPWSPAPWAALGEAQLGAGLVRDARVSFRKAASMDPRDWHLWYDVARASSGRARLDALHRAVALYPHSRLLPERSQ
jgi:hypothetical protein